MQVQRAARRDREQRAPQDLPEVEGEQPLGRELCDLAHDGNGAELDLAFGQAGDQPLLGDLDGDGRDDPCVLRAGHLLCDTAHDGGAAETDLLLATQPGDRPLLANLDAL